MKQLILWTKHLFAREPLSPPLILQLGLVTQLVGVWLSCLNFLIDAGVSPGAEVAELEDSPID